jgi:catechol 2,3-dioxygenase-like lactoylglutathione lyase family enzyme
MKKGVIHHLEIYVSDIEKTRKFWSLLLEELGYKIYQEFNNGFSYKLDDTYLVFVKTEDEYLKNGYHRKNIGLNHIAFHGESVENIERIKSILLENNTVFLYEDRYPYAGGNGYYALFFEDPNRIKVEIGLN